MNGTLIFEDEDKSLVIFPHILNTYVDKISKQIMGIMNTLRKFCVMKSVRDKAKEEESEKDKKN